jgi:hypothetical protein
MSAPEAHQLRAPIEPGVPPPRPTPPGNGGGIRASRIAVRRTGPLLGLAIPAGLGALALVALAGSESTARGVTGLVLATLAAPTLPIFGLPIADGGARTWLAVGLAVVLWAGVGALAAHRATRRPVAGPAEWWREYLRLAVGIWLGALGALVLAALVLGATIV